MIEISSETTKLDIYEQTIASFIRKKSRTVTFCMSQHPTWDILLPSPGNDYPSSACSEELQLFVISKKFANEHRKLKKSINSNHTFPA